MYFLFWYMLFFHSLIFFYQNHITLFYGICSLQMMNCICSFRSKLHCRTTINVVVNGLECIFFNTRLTRICNNAGIFTCRWQQGEAWVKGTSCRLLRAKFSSMACKASDVFCCIKRTMVELYIWCSFLGFANRMCECILYKIYMVLSAMYCSFCQWLY
jgi:hypothetical protein